MLHWLVLSPNPGLHILLLMIVISSWFLLQLIPQVTLREPLLASLGLNLNVSQCKGSSASSGIPGRFQHDAYLFPSVLPTNSCLVYLKTITSFRSLYAYL